MNKGTMAAEPVLESHFGMDVWTNPTVEPIRRAECMCFSCGTFKVDTEDKCRIADLLYAVCRETGIAAPVIRCPKWTEPEE